MKTLTDTELKKLSRLETQLHEAISHSPQAINIGKQIAKVYQTAHIRNNPPNPAIDKAMAKLAKKLGI